MREITVAQCAPSNCSRSIQLPTTPNLLRMGGLQHRTDKQIVSTVSKWHQLPATAVVYELESLQPHAACLLTHYYTPPPGLYTPMLAKQGFVSETHTVACVPSSQRVRAPGPNPPAPDVWDEGAGPVQPLGQQ